MLGHSALSELPLSSLPSIADGSLTLTGTGGVLSLTGGSASFIRETSLTGSGGVLTLTGGNAAFARAVSLIGSGGVLTLSGGSAEFVFQSTQAQSSGGWLAYNDAAARRRKRLQEQQEEDEADRLERLLAEEGKLPPNSILDDRITVREYALQADAFNKRTQRAIDYALKARTDLAYQLAAREIANQLEDEEYAVLLLLAAA